jgi:hypothetical protein
MSLIYFIVKDGKVLKKHNESDVLLIGEKVMEIEESRHPKLNVSHLIIQDGELHDTRAQGSMER